MSDLFDKLNLLLRSSLDTFLKDLGRGGGDVPHPDQIPPEALRDERSIAALERQIAAMRKRIDEALNTEDGMKARLDKLLEQAEAYDLAADQALERGDEAEARRLVGQMQHQRHLANMVRAELEDHRAATSEFMVRVNMLEATVIDARHAQGTLPPDVDAPASEAKPRSQTTTPAPAIPPIPPELVELGKATGTAINDVLRTLKERAETALAPLTTRPPETKPAAATQAEGTPAQPATVDTATAERATAERATAERATAQPAAAQPAAVQPAAAPPPPTSGQDAPVPVPIRVNVSAAPPVPPAAPPTALPGDTPRRVPVIKSETPIEAAAATTTATTAATTNAPSTTNPSLATPPAASDRAIEEDLARRRSRLSKPDDAG
jgi:hypothetical protein